ncbi:alpha/beta fold hydrolase [Mycoplasma sp. 2704]|uniref:alpha/beta fold hydrolase n=2 Tax=unclassified Mycoplasma TaxID=2683645 RepID=UPI002B1E8FA5|nr:alpha/beta fold hydrolase [Mycoplasma sp. 2704]MEA4134484.1 alpha/beta fold hydrolase [Mycoplasma sp. 2704]
MFFSNSNQHLASLAKRVIAASAARTQHYFKPDRKNKIWYTISGNPKGFPVLVIHDGPGKSSNMDPALLLNLNFFKFIFFDQRGCGKSTPHINLKNIKNNTTDQTVEDIERLRKHLKLDKLIIWGDGWGATLTLMYAIKYPQNVATMILRSVFLARQEDIDFLYEGKGANWFRPKEYKEFTNAVANFDGKTNIEKYYKALTNKKLDYKFRKKLAIIFCKWQFTISENNTYRLTVHYYKQVIYQLALLKCHYFYNKSFLPNDNYILENVDKYKHIQTYIVHPHLDFECRLIGTYLLEKKLENVKRYSYHYSSHDFIENTTDANTKKVFAEIENELKNVKKYNNLFRR